MYKYTYDEKTNLQLPIVFCEEYGFEDDETPMFKLVFVKAGSGIVKVNDNTVIFSSPSIFFLNNKDKIEIVKEVGLEAEVISFAPETINREFSLERIEKGYDDLKKENVFDMFLLNPFIIRNERYHGYYTLTPKSSIRVFELESDIVTSLKELKAYWRCRTRALVLEVLFYAQNLMTTEDTSGLNPVVGLSDDVNNIILYIHTNYDEKLTIADLASEHGTNRTTLSKRFQDETGYTINKYITKTRMDVAAMMLRETLLPISELSYRVGFKDKTHFTRTFKKMFDILPSKYREEMFGR